MYGLAGMWDSGQLTSHDVVMKTSFFLNWFGTETGIEPYLSDVRVEGAGGQSLPPRGVARFKLAISGLPSLVPNDVAVLLCDNLRRQIR